ncbi:MAG: prolyl oligopeptidase family serine peptidase [Gammaproteobacteria bacterium]
MPALLLAAQVAAAPALPPATPQAPTETRFAITLRDPDRWLQDLLNPDVQQWIKGQADYTRAVLDSIPGRAATLADIERLERTTTARIDEVILMPNERLLIRRREANAETARLYLREGYAGAERMLVDPDDWKKRTGKPHAIDYAVPSPDGKLAVVGIAEAGAEMATAHVVDLATGKVSGSPITGIWFGGSIGWLPDSSGFTYNRVPDLQPGQDATQQRLNTQAWLHRLGTEVSKDKLIFGNRYDEALGIDPTSYAVVVMTPDSEHLVGGPFSVDNRLTLFTAPRADLEADRIHWRKVIKPDDAVRDFELHGDDLYLLSATEPNRRIERLSLGTGERSIVVASGALPIDDIHGTPDALYYVTKRESGVGSDLHRLPWGATASAQVPLPGFDTLTLYPTLYPAKGLHVQGTGWSQFPAIRRLDGEGRVRSTNLQPLPKGVDANALVARTVQVPSHDGTLVPLSIVHRKGLARDGRNPTLLQGYGSYGISTEPVLVPAFFAYFDRGFVRAFCHVRGGGEKGEAWYRAGFQATKANTWKDFNACAEYLIKEKYTSPARLAGLGGSAGGILISNAMIERPELYAVMMPQVGVNDSVAAALYDPNGPVNWPEFGDPNTEAGFKSLVGMSAYQKVKDGTVFPAVMLPHGYNDPRVAVWHSAKMAARLQRATSSGKPVLLNIDYETGHGIGSAQSAVNNQRTDLIVFMLWQFGVEGYTPKLKLH